MYSSGLRFNSSILINYAQAKKLMRLIQAHTDWNKLTVGDVLDMNKITAQLEEFIQEVEAIPESKMMETNNES